MLGRHQLQRTDVRLGRLLRRVQAGAVAGALLLAAAFAPAAHAAATPGTSSAMQGPRPLAASSADALSLQASQTVTGDYVAAGTGLRNRGYGTITISGIPTGATVKAAYLVWDILDNSQEPSLANGNFNGAPIQGTFTGSGASPCWPASNNFSFFADVTSLVTGNGAYSLTGFASGATDGSDPWSSGSPAPEAEGASLVVVYTENAAPTETVQLYTGAQETGVNGPLSATLSGFTVSSPVGAQSTFIVADGQGAGSDASFNSTDLNHTFLGADPISPPPLSQGNLWDT